MIVEPSGQSFLAVAERFERLTLDCGGADAPGIADLPDWQDFSERDTTNDQLRIEEVIATLRLGCRGALLHVGIGNSGLAQRFATQFAKIAGITIQQGEIDRAAALGLAGYEVAFANKYRADLVRSVKGPFHVIVDNNPTSFCCCRTHFLTMMQSYAELLAPGGVLLSDRKGLRWTTIPNDPAWGLALAEWEKIGVLFELAPVSYTESVVGLMKPE